MVGVCPRVSESVQRILNVKQFFFFENDFHRWKVVCVRESVRTRGIVRACRHSSRIMHLLECVWLPSHVHLGGE